MSRFLCRVKLKLQKDDPNFGKMKESSLFFPEQSRKIYQIFCYLAMKAKLNDLSSYLDSPPLWLSRDRFRFKAFYD